MKKLAAILGGVLLVVSSATSSARPITFGFRGTLDQIVTDNGLSGSIPIGSEIVGTYTFDSNAPNSSFTPESGRYRHRVPDFSPPIGVAFSVAGIDFASFPTTTHGPAWDNVLLDIFIDKLSCCTPWNYGVSSFVSSEGSNEFDFFAIRLSDFSAPQPPSLVTHELVAVPPNLSEWDSVLISLAGPSGQITGRLTELLAVNEPSVASHLVLGAAALLGSLVTSECRGRRGRLTP